MIARKYYKLKIEAGQGMDTITVVEFEFNSIPEVKNFIKRIGDNEINSAHYISMKLWEINYVWNMQTGYVSKTSTAINLDS